MMRNFFEVSASVVFLLATISLLVIVVKRGRQKSEEAKRQLREANDPRRNKRQLKKLTLVRASKETLYVVSAIITIVLSVPIVGGNFVAISKSLNMPDVGTMSGAAAKERLNEAGLGNLKYELSDGTEVSFEAIREPSSFVFATEPTPGAQIAATEQVVLRFKRRPLPIGTYYPEDLHSLSADRATRLEIMKIMNDGRSLIFETKLKALESAPTTIQPVVLFENGQIVQNPDAIIRDNNWRKYGIQQTDGFWGRYEDKELLYEDASGLLITADPLHDRADYLVVDFDLGDGSADFFPLEVRFSEMEFVPTIENK